MATEIWTQEEDDHLLLMWNDTAMTAHEMARAFGRSDLAIKCRIFKLLDEQRRKVWNSQPN